MRERLKHLGQLVGRRMEIERKILERTRELEKAYLMAGQELAVILTGRKKDVEGAFGAKSRVKVDVSEEVR